MYYTMLYLVGCVSGILPLSKRLAVWISLYLLFRDLYKAERLRLRPKVRLYALREPEGI